MEIDKFQIVNAAHPFAKPTTLGLNIQREFGQTTVNMFAINLNQGPAISDHFWNAARDITRKFLDDEPIDAVRWTLTSGHVTTKLAFTTLNGSPFKVDVSNDHVVREERMGQHFFNPKTFNFSLEKFRNEGAEILSRSASFSLGRTPVPESVFTLPCSNPAAADGMFCCVLPFYHNERMRQDYGYLLADTAKMVDVFKREDPDLVKHALSQWGDYRGYVSNSSFVNPRRTATWSHDLRSFSVEGVLFVTFILSEEIPYVPIAFYKKGREDQASTVRSLLGYGGDEVRHKLRPRFVPSGNEFV